MRDTPRHAGGTGGGGFREPLVLAGFRSAERDPQRIKADDTRRRPGDRVEDRPKIQALAQGAAQSIQAGQPIAPALLPVEEIHVLDEGGDEIRRLLCQLHMA